MVDVPAEGESQDKNYTRDRFGRTHRLANEDGSPRIRTMRHISVLLFLIIALSVSAVSYAEDSRRNRQLGPNVQMTSENMESAWDRLSDKEKKEDEFNLLKNGDTVLGFNENGDPSLSTRF